jgi:DNA ligase-1
MELKKLYKRSTTGKISEWQIFVEGDKFYTVSGFSDGLKITSDKTLCESKSYCTAAEQAIKQATAIHKKKMELGAFENVKDIDKPILFKPMLAHDYDDYKDKIKFPLATQPKLDGVRCIIKLDGMWSRNGKEIISAPHIFKSLKPLFELDPDLIFDGELYTDKLADDFNKIISCVRKTKPTQEDLEESEKWIEYHIYDLPSCDDVFKNRFKTLSTLDLPENCIIVPTEQIDNINDLMAYYEDYMHGGYEGQILRVLDSLYENKRSKSLLKHKSFQTEEFIILSVKEGIGKLQNKVGTVQIKTNDGVEVDVTVNGTHDFLADLWKRQDELIGKEATIRYFGYTPDGSLRFPKVIDISRWDYE